MPTPPLERRKAEVLLPGYAKLLKDVRNIFLLGRERIEREKVLTYWKAGRRIQRDVLRNKGRADYGRQVLLRLSEDLGIDQSVLQRSVRFAEQFPILARGPKLSWSHYRVLIPVEDEKKLFDLAERAERFQWTASQLMGVIKKEVWTEAGGPKLSAFKKETSSFRPKRGTVGACRVVLSDVLLIDLGFSTFIEPPALKSGRFKEGDIVNASTKHLTLLKDATAACLYTYTAEVEKVADGDTLWLWIGLGFNLWVRQKVRLRGIDAPELDTQAGLAAKRFIESQLESVKEVTVTTTKPDKFDRYLADLWIGNTNLNQLLLETGHARPLSQVPDSLWDESNWGRF